MNFDIKNVLRKFKLSKEGEKNFSEEKKTLSEYKVVTDSEKAKRKDASLLFNSGKKPLKEKLDLVNYGMAKPKLSSGLLNKKINNIEKTGKEDDKEKEQGKKQVEIEKIKDDAKKKLVADKNRLSSAWQAPKIIKTNLVKGEITTFIDWKKNVHDLSLIGGVAIGIIVAWYIGLVITGMGIENQGRILEGEIDSLKAQIITAQDKVSEIDRFQEKLKYSSVLLDNHIYWTNFFKFLEDNLLPTTRITDSLSIEPNGKYGFSLTTDSYESMTNQLVLLRSLKEVVSVVSDGASQDKVLDSLSGKESNVVSYNIDIVLDTSLFKK